MKNRTRIRAQEIYRERLNAIYRDTDRVFFWLFLVQWAVAVAIALVISPFAWAGSNRSIHLHLQIAIIGGAVLNALPFTLMRLRPGRVSTRHVVAVTQMLWSAIFVHLTGGRIETHFHIFGSLAFLAFYRDPRLLLTATLVVAADHLAIGFFWPESVYGIANPEWWRFLEHAAWVIFEDIVLYLGITRQLREKRTLTEHEAALEVAMQDVEQQVADRTEQLKSSSERYRAVIENTSAVPWEIDKNSCQIVYLAPQIKSIFGLAAEDAAKENFLAVFHPEDRAPFKEFIARTTRAGGEDKSFIDTRIVDADNRVKHVRSFVADQSSRADARTVFGISLDITKQKALELDLIQAQKLESIGQLSAGIAHEINTPTQFIGDNVRFLHETVGEVLKMVEQVGLLVAAGEASATTIQSAQIGALYSALDMPYLKEEIPKAISQTLDGIARISKIVGAMKEFSHPALDKTPYDLNRAITSTITVASNEWKYVAEIKADLDPELPHVTVMPGAFNQVILNILVNAAHAIAGVNAAMPLVKGVITLSTRTVMGWAEIRIQDTGGGIPDKIRDKIFDPFFTTKAVGKGTGQGLAIAHDVIVKKHGGTISVESEAGVGTTFVVRLPLDATVTAAAAVA
jgi:PAS domain S-box-containing protein